ncbi:hypothetical protein HZC08_01745, partial [Candidatus Micrarchaeota archaeon]|nr:hypothetical protein [Candidatus Micrarchaeota archaeon]
MSAQLQRRAISTTRFDPSATSVSGRFGKYKPEPHIIETKAVVTSDN